MVYTRTERVDFEINHNIRYDLYKKHYYCYVCHKNLINVKEHINLNSHNINYYNFNKEQQQEEEEEQRRQERMKEYEQRQKEIKNDCRIFMNLIKQVEIKTDNHKLNQILNKYYDPSESESSDSEEE